VLFVALNARSAENEVAKPASNRHRLESCGRGLVGTLAVPISE